MALKFTNARLRLRKFRVAMLLLAPVWLMPFQNCGQFRPQHTTSASVTNAQNIPLEIPTLAFTITPPTLSNSSSLQVRLQIKLSPQVTAKSVTCQLDNSPAVNCTNLMWSLTGITDGDHVLTVRAEDSMGQQAQPIMATVRVDTAAPLITVSQQPALVSATTNPVVGFSAVDSLSGVEKTECSLDNAPFANCASPMQVPPLASGAHSLRLRSTDRAGNVSALTTLNWTVDLSAPTVTVSSRPANFANSRTAAFSFAGTSTGSPIASYQCNLNNAGYTACTSPANYSGLNEGPQTFAVRAVTQIGTMSSPISVAWTVDTSAPSAPVFSANVGAVTMSRSANLSFLSSDSGSGIASYQCSQNGAAYANCASPLMLTNLAEAGQIVNARAVDAAGNTSAAGQFAWTVDATAPNLDFTSTPGMTTDKPLSVFAFTATDAGSGIDRFTCQLDTAAPAACTSPKDFGNLSVGSHKVTVTAFDRGGNNKSTSYSWIISSSPATLDGAKLYADNCAGCHGALASSNKLGRSDAQISGAIAGIPQMMSQGNLVSLTNDQIRAIATAIGGAVTTVPGTTPTAPIGACKPGAVRGIAKEAIRRLTRSELKTTLYAVLPNANFLDAEFEIYPDPDVNEEVEKYDQLYSHAQAEIWTNITDLIADKVIADRLYDRMDGACLGTAPITDACWDGFFKNYGRKVFRRPLPAAEITRLKGYVLPITSQNEAIRQAIHLLFRSPSFLFHIELGVTEETLRVRLTDHEVANRISYALLGSPPDGELSAAADRGELKTLAQVNSQALRLINQPTARAKLNRFFAEWLQVSAVKTPGWEYFEWMMGLGKTPGMDTVFRREIMDYVDYIAFRKKGNFQDLMTSPIAFPRYQGIDYDNNKQMSALSGIYGNDKYANFSTFETNEPTPFPAPNNPGLLSRAGFHVTSRLSTDPINRGVFVLRRILCVNLPSPDFSVVSARLADTGNLDPVMLPNHQIVSKRTEPTNCMQCHSKINPMGFALEPFDTIGKRRKVESVIDMKLFYGPEKGIAKTHPLLSTVTGVDFGDKIANITSPEALADTIATSKQAQSCMSTFVLRHFDRRKENSGDSCQVEEVATQLNQGRPLVDVFVNSIANEDIFWRRK